MKERKSERETGSEEKKKEKGGESASAYVVAIYSWLAAQFVRIVCVRDRLREREPQKERASERELVCCVGLSVLQSLTQYRF